MDYRARNLPSKRTFGKDITNLDRRGKNASICEKPGMVPELRNNKSRSFASRTSSESKEALLDYETDIVNFMLNMQRKEKRELLVHTNEQMRQILIDWLVDVHLSFGLKEQTLYLALCYLNEYCSLHEVTKLEYQLVGIACLWIASKFEEIYPPKMHNYIQVTDSSYTAAELKAMEGKIVSALNFNLSYVTALQLLELASDKWQKKSREAKLADDAQRTLFLCKYLLQLSLFEGLGRDYCMKTLVLSCIMLADSVLKQKTESKLLEGERLERDSVMSCFKEVCVVLQNASKQSTKTKAIRRKYLDESRMAVAKFRIQHK